MKIDALSRAIHQGVGDLDNYEEKPEGGWPEPEDPYTVELLTADMYDVDGTPLTYQRRMDLQAAKMKARGAGLGGWSRPEDDPTRVGFDYIDGAEISTVWIGHNMNFGPTGPPVIFETMLFGGPENAYQRRYSTWEQAEAGHAEIVAWARRHYLRAVEDWDVG